MDRCLQFPSFLIQIAVASTVLSGCASTRPAALIPVLGQSHSDQSSEFVVAWNDWADHNLQDGDLVFMRGDCFMLMNTVNFSKLSTDLTDSRFSHIGLIAVEDGEAYVYDIQNRGCLRTRFGDLMAHKMLHQLAIKRYREMSPTQLSETARFCRRVHERHEKFDSQFLLENDRYYCAELVEAAYRCEGHPLSEPIPIHDLPNYAKHARQILLIQSMTHISPDQPVLLPGNDNFGIWANPELDLIIDLPDTKVRPPK